MQHTKTTLMISILIVSLWGSASAEPLDDGKAGHLITSIEISDAQAAIDASEYLVLDVRTPAEYASGHIDGAFNINVLDDTFASRVKALDRDRTYIVHCAANVTNGRTDKAITIMDDLGFKHLLSLKGGIAAWMVNELPITSSSAEQVPAYTSV